MTRTLTLASLRAANTLAAMPIECVMPSPTTAISANSPSSVTLSGCSTRRISSRTDSEQS